MEAWPEIIPLTERSVPNFPVAALPEPLQSYVTQVAESFQVPADLPGCLVLAVVAAATAKAVEVQVSPDWKEPTNLFTVTVLPSGQRKSAVFKEVMAPLERAEFEALEMFPDKSNPERSKVRLLVDDVTPERLAILLAGCKGKLALMSPEGGVFEMMTGRYNRGVANLDVYLKGHAGDTFRFDRRDGTSEIVIAPALTMGLAIQPDVLYSLASKQGLRGQGLMARFLYAVPHSMLGRRKIETNAVATDVRAAYCQTIQVILRTCQGKLDTPYLLSVEAGALALIREHQQDIELMLAPGGDLERIGDWANKLTGALVRIAAGFHCIATPDAPSARPISRDSIGRAIVFANYFQAHAIAAFDSMGVDAVFQGAKRLAACLSAHKNARISARDLFQVNKYHFKRMPDMLASMSILVERGYARRIFESSRREGPGRPASALYEINPSLYESAPQFTQNSESGYLDSTAGVFLRNLRSAFAGST
jgi:replicative DNA helicase